MFNLINCRFVAYDENAFLIKKKKKENDLPYTGKSFNPLVPNSQLTSEFLQYIFFSYETNI